MNENRSHPCLLTLIPDGSETEIERSETIRITVKGFFALLCDIKQS